MPLLWSINFSLEETIMGQWGETLTEKGVQFVIHINTQGANPVRPESVVDYIGFLTDVNDKLEAEILKKYVGKLYSEI